MKPWVSVSMMSLLVGIACSSGQGGPEITIAREGGSGGEAGNSLGKGASKKKKPEGKKPGDGTGSSDDGFDGDSGFKQDQAQKGGTGDPGSTPDPDPTQDPYPDPDPTQDPYPDPDPTQDPYPDPDPTQDPYPDPDPTQGSPSPTPDDDDRLTYEDVKGIYKAACANCHAAMPPSNQDDLIAMREETIERLESDDPSLAMPLGSPNWKKSSEGKAFLRWLEEGAEFERARVRR